MTIQKPKRNVGRPRQPDNLKINVGEYTLKNMARFWGKVNKNGPIPPRQPELGPCWEWMGGGNGKGSGQVRINYRQMSAHKVAWELTHGTIPQGLWVLHKCENANCVNPRHLFLGTAKDNAEATIRKSRLRPDTMRSTGSKRHHLTMDEIAEMEARFENGESQAALAREFDVSRVTVSNILKGRTRKTR